MSVNARSRYEHGGLAVSQGDGAGFIQKKHINITRSLHRSSGHRYDIGLYHAVHARYAYRGKQSAYCGRDKTDKQGDEHRNGDGAAMARGLDAKYRKRKQCRRDKQKDDGKSGQQYIEGYLVWGLLALGPLHHGYHAV